MFSLTGKTALITGGARGIGLSIAKAFLRQNAEVILADNDAEQLLITQNELQETAPGRVLQCKCDITSQDSVDALQDFIVGKGKGLHILVNNAGIFRQMPMEETTPEVMELLFQVNVIGMFRISRTLLPFLKKQGGKIINISSYLSEIGRIDAGGYIASKGAVRQLTKAMAVEWAQYNIQVNAIAPGSMITEMTAKNQTNHAWVDFLKKRIPQGCLGNADDIGYCAVFLASAASNYITGINMPVDGGILASL